MCICLLVALFVREKNNFFIGLVGHQIGCAMSSLGIEPKAFLLTDLCTTTRIMPVTDLCQLKHHLQTEGQIFFRNLSTLAAQQPK